MNPSLPHTRGSGDSGARLCACGNKISSKDAHQVCSCCLGLEHAQLALEAPGSCVHCARFTMKSLRRRLACQVSLSGTDLHLPTAGIAADGGDKEGTAEAEPCASTSWGSQLDLAAAVPPMEEVLELDYEDDDEDTSEPLISDDEVGEDDIFIPPFQAATPNNDTAPRGGEDSTPASPAPSMDLQNVCKRAASRLNMKRIP